MTDALPAVTTLAADPTLDEIAAALIDDVAANAAFDGWSATAVQSAAMARGIDADLARLALPGNSMELIDRWFASIDAGMARRLPPETLATMKIRDRIRQLVWTRLDIARPNRESLRRALAIMAMPHHVAAATRLGWRTADHMWRLAGDQATDFNHYTKRLSLSALYASTIAVFINDDDPDLAATSAFLDRRIDDVMRVERTKHRIRTQRAQLPSLSRFIGRLRYPSV